MTTQDLTNLQKSVESTGNQLNTVANKLTEVENQMKTGDDVDELSVMELLESMSEVRNDYQNLRKDIQEVQQLQKEMTISLRYQMRTMTQTFRLLKKRIQLSKIAQN